MVKKATQPKQPKAAAAKKNQPIAKAEKPASPVAKKLMVREGPKWNLAKLEMGQILSMTSYMTVIGLGSMVTVKNQHGHVMQMSKSLVETMYSAQHYEREIALNMTGLAELLQSVQDVIFTVNFKKQATEQNALEALANASAATFKDPKQLSQLAKQIVAGQDCSMTCHMLEVENNLGRSLVIDLGATTESQFRQVDHRSIESIIFKNVKYALKKGGKSFGDIDTNIPKDEPKWDSSQLAIGNRFSGTSYYETVTDMASTNEVFCYEKNFNDRGVTIDKSIMRDEMHNATLYESEESLSITNLATKLVEANNMCFQVCFTCKASDKKVLEELSELKAAPKSDKEARELAKRCLVGNEQTLVCRLSKAEGKLGRSLVVELSKVGYRQVDHRSIKWLVIDNVKYTLKK